MFSQEEGVRVYVYGGLLVFFFQKEKDIGVGEPSGGLENVNKNRQFPYKWGQGKNTIQNLCSDPFFYI